MAKLIMWNLMTLDGMFEGPQPWDLDWHEYAWGDELMPGGRHMANVWQGEFPGENLALDGFAGTAPVDVVPPDTRPRDTGPASQSTADSPYVNRYRRGTEHSSRCR